MLAVGFRRVRAAVALAGTVALAVTAGGCGQPEFHYVKNSERKTYFKVPNAWHQVDQEDLDRIVAGADPASATAQLRSELIWTVAYDAQDDPAVTHIFGFGVTPEPVVWAKVERLTPTVSGAVSFDLLRDAVLPVTEDARKSAAEQGNPLGAFELLHDEVLTPAKGLHGVRVVYNYDLPAGGTLHTFDQTALVNDDASVLYLLLVRCTAACYRDRANELAGIVHSFTVRSSP